MRPSRTRIGTVLEYAKRGDRAIAWVKGGLSTKIHATVDAVVPFQRLGRARSRAPTSQAFRRTRSLRGTSDRLVPPETVFSELVPRLGCNPRRPLRPNHTRDDNHPRMDAWITGVEAMALFMSGVPAIKSANARVTFSSVSAASRICTGNRAQS